MFGGGSKAKIGRRALAPGCPVKHHANRVQTQCGWFGGHRRRPVHTAGSAPVFLDRFPAAFAGSDADAILHRQDKNLAVAGLAEYGGAIGR